MFAFAESFNSDLSEWDTSNLENAARMFERATSFHGKGVENWNVTKVINMAYMFAVRSMWFDADLSKWDVSNVEGKLFCFIYFSYRYFSC
jgi:surface protein